MSVYLSIKSGSEADKRLQALLDSALKDRKRLSEIARRLNCDPECFTTSGGRLHAFRSRRCGGGKLSSPPNVIPGGWMKSRLFPKRCKANRELLTEIESLSPFVTPSRICESLTGETDTRLRLRGMMFVSGIGFEQIGHRRVLTFHDEEHRDDIVSKPSWPKGTRPVKNSTVERWREAEG